MIFSLAAAAGTVVAQYVIGAILLLLALVLIVIILQQTGKESSLSGTISGNTETFFGKSGGNGNNHGGYSNKSIGSAAWICRPLQRNGNSNGYVFRGRGIT